MPVAAVNPAGTIATSPACGVCTEVRIQDPPAQRREVVANQVRAKGPRRDSVVNNNRIKATQHSRSIVAA